MVNYSIAFLLTIGLETTVAWLLGYRKRAEIAAVFWVNVFSHPLLHLVIGIVGLVRAASVSSGEILFLEVCVVLVEWQLLCYALPRQSKMRLLLLSLAMNCVSYYFPSLFGS